MLYLHHSFVNYILFEITESFFFNIKSIPPVHIVFIKFAFHFDNLRIRTHHWYDSVTRSLNLLNIWYSITWFMLIIVSDCLKYFWMSYDYFYGKQQFHLYKGCQGKGRTRIIFQCYDKTALHSRSVHTSILVFKFIQIQIQILYWIKPRIYIVELYTSFKW
jgi:hypothetical protein